MLFSDVIGQSQIKRQLQRAVEEQRVSHAQLFLGPPGSGNLSMALAFAQYLNCENKQNGDSCGTCPSCNKAQKLIHPDIHFTFPIFKSDKKETCADWMPEWRTFISETPYGDYEDWVRMNDVENKQGNITAHECQEILRILTLKNFEAPYKILILWLPEFLEKEGNRLLKIIEEPPDNTVFLFVANDQERIINTILSRMQLVKFPRLREVDITSALAEKHGLNTEQSKKLAAMSEGNYQAALHFLHTQEDNNTLLLQEWIHACRHSNVKTLFAWNDRWTRMGREYQKSFLHYAMHFYRQMLLQSAGLDVSDKLTPAEVKIAREVEGALGSDAIARITGLLDKSIYFVERNANAKILITYISVSIMQQFRGQNKPNNKPFFLEWEA